MEFNSAFKWLIREVRAGNEGKKPIGLDRRNKLLDNTKDACAKI
jgi:hypothetical protein